MSEDRGREGRKSLRRTPRAEPGNPSARHQCPEKDKRPQVHPDPWRPGEGLGGEHYRTPNSTRTPRRCSWGCPTPPPRTPETQSHHEDLPRDTQPHPPSVKDMKTRPRNRRGRGRLRRNSGCTQAHGRDPGQNWDPWGTVRPRAVCGPGSVNTPAAANLPPSREVLRGGSTGLCRLPPACKWRQPDLPGRENGSRAGSFSDRAKFAC